MQQIIKKVMIALVVISLLYFLYQWTPLSKFLSLPYIQAQGLRFKALVEQKYLLAAMAYILLFAGTIALALPTSILLTLLGGYLFGTIYGTIYAMLGVTAGVVIAFLIMRFFLQRSLHQVHKEKLEHFQQSIAAYGVSYILILHFSAVLPYFVINAFAILSGISLRTVVWTTMVGFLPQAIVYAMAGKELGSIKKINDLFSWQLMLACFLLMCLAMVPMLIKKLKKQ